MITYPWRVVKLFLLNNIKLSPLLNRLRPGWIGPALLNPPQGVLLNAEIQQGEHSTGQAFHPDGIGWRIPWGRRINIQRGRRKHEIWTRHRNGGQEHEIISCQLSAVGDQLITILFGPQWNSPSRFHRAGADWPQYDAQYLPQLNSLQI